MASRDATLVKQRKARKCESQLERRSGRRLIAVEPFRCPGHSSGVVHALALVGCGSDVIMPTGVSPRLIGG